MFVPFDSAKLDIHNTNNTVKYRPSSSDKRWETKEKFVAPICGKIILPKEYIRTQKVTNGPNLITQSELPATEVIVVEKIKYDLSFNSILTE